MNRRGFLAALIGGAVVAVAAPAEAHHHTTKARGPQPLEPQPAAALPEAEREALDAADKEHSQYYYYRPVRRRVVYRRPVRRRVVYYRRPVRTVYYRRPVRRVYYRRPVRVIRYF
jgi:hypothetical protein